MWLIENMHDYFLNHWSIKKEAYLWFLAYVRKRIQKNSKIDNIRYNFIKKYFATFKNL